ncbi:MAG: hypothetical protein ACFCU4_08410 [Puniceicoccaceae bacterium]
MAGRYRGDCERDDLSNLFELKKLERPTEAYWEGFDRELKQKLVQKLVEPPVSRRLISRFGASFSSASVLISSVVASLLALAAIGLVPVVTDRQQGGVSGGIALDGSSKKPSEQAAGGWSEKAPLELDVYHRPSDERFQFSRAGGEFSFEDLSLSESSDLVFVTESFSTPKLGVEKRRLRTSFAN